MLVSVLQENLTRGLGIVGRAVAPRSTLPVLGNVLLATDDQRLKLSATNLEISITCWIGAQVEEDGGTTSPAKTIVDLVNLLPPGQLRLDLNERTQTLHFKTPTTSNNIKGVTAEEFPVIPRPAENEMYYVNTVELRTALAQVIIAAANNDTKPMMCGVLLRVKKGRLTLAGADGFRLSTQSLPIARTTATVTELEKIVPATALAELLRISSTQTDEIGIAFTGAQVLFQLTNIELVAQVLDGKFPPYEAIIPKRTTLQTIVPCADLLKAVKRAGVFAREAADIVRLTFKPDSRLMTIGAQSAETGDGATDLTALLMTGNAMEIAFNVKYLVDMLNVMTGPLVSIQTTDATKPGVFFACNAAGQTVDEFLHIIMPMHIGSNTPMPKAPAPIPAVVEAIEAYVAERTAVVSVTETITPDGRTINISVPQPIAVSADELVPA